MFGLSSFRWRHLRSGVLAGLSAEISVGGHLLGRGNMPDLTVLVAVTALMTVMGASTVVRQLRFGQLLALSGGAQVGFHLMFMLNMHHGSAVALAPMAVFHGCAAVVASALLAAGDRILFQLWDFLRRVVPRRPLAASLAGVPAIWVPVIAAGVSYAGVLQVATARPRRGPPAERPAPPLTAS